MRTDEEILREMDQRFGGHGAVKYLPISRKPKVPNRRGKAKLPGLAINPMGEQKDTRVTEYFEVRVPSPPDMSPPHWPPDLSDLTDEQIGLVACMAQIQAAHELGCGPVDSDANHKSNAAFYSHTCTILHRWSVPMPKELTLDLEKPRSPRTR